MVWEITGQCSPSQCTAVLPFGTLTCTELTDRILHFLKTYLRIVAILCHQGEFDDMLSILEIKVH